MAKRVTKKVNNTELDGKEFFAAIAQIEQEKGIKPGYMMEKISQALLAAYRRDHEGVGDNLMVEADPDTNSVRMFLKKDVVEVVDNPGTEISLEEARLALPQARLGDVIRIEIKPKSFGRIAAPAWFGGGAFYIFLLRQFYMTIPKDFDEAAYLDGANHFQIFTRIILPITKPSLAVVGLFTFMNTWNDFLGPLVYLNDEAKYTVALGLQLFTGSYRSEWHLMMAAACLVLIPVILVFIVGQRYLIEGITMSGVKG